MESRDTKEIPGPAQEAFEAGSKEFVAGNDAAALDHFLTAIELYPEFYDANYMVGLAQLRTGDKSGAVASFNKVIDRSENVMLRDYAEKKLASLDAS